MLNQLTIQGFRGIRSLTVDDLAFVNVLIGPNGAGKTSVLEAASIAANPVNPSWLANLSIWREMPPVRVGAEDGLRTCFYGLSGQREIRLTWKASENSGSLMIRPLDTYRYLPAEMAGPQGFVGSTGPTGTLLTSEMMSGSSSGSEDQFGGVQYEYEPSTGPPQTLTATLVAEGLTISAKAPPSRTPSMGAFYIHARRATSSGETASLLTSVTETRRESAVYQALRRVDKRLLRLLPGLRGNAPVVLADIGLPRLVPTSALGDGFSRVLLMVTGAVMTKTLVIVDEIDSGLHPSVMEGFWASLIELRRLKNFQVLCTTHSEEMLRDTLRPFSEEPEMLRVFRVDRNASDDVSLQKYDYGLLRDASSAGMDIR